MQQSTAQPTAALLFEGGFRIFFLSAAFYSALIMVLWILDLSGTTEFLGTFSLLPGSLWHAHELIFGFIMAVVAGFLTTAVPGWADSPRIRGAELAFLYGLWVLGRLAVLFSEVLPMLLSSLIDLAFIPILVWIIAKRIIAKKLWRNMGFIPLLLLIFTGNLLVWLEMLAFTTVSATTGIRLAIGLLVLMTILIGGRVTPVFTGNWLKRHNMKPLPESPGWLTKATLLSCLAAILGELFFPQTLPGSILYTIAGLLILLRLSYWQGWRTLKDPLMWVLHLGYAFLGFGFLAEGISILVEDFPEILANHVLTIGGLGIMILGMMSRIALGHTGRPLKVSPVISFSYVLILISLIARIIPPLALPDLEEVGLHLAGTSWTLAWLLYLWIYTPILSSPRADGKEG